MTTIPVGFTEAVFRFQRLGAPRISTWTLGVEDLSVPDPPPATTASVLYNIFSTGTSPFKGTSMLGNWQFIGVTCTLMQEVGPLVGEFNSTTSGAAAGSAMPPNCSVLLKKNTVSGGRRNRGRAYIPPVWPPETNVDGDGTITSGEVATLQSQYNACYTAMLGAAVHPVLFHSEAPFTPTTITGFTVQPLIATQRRRLRK